MKKFYNVSLSCFLVLFLKPFHGAVKIREEKKEDVNYCPLGLSSSSSCSAITFESEILCSGLFWNESSS